MLGLMAELLKNIYNKEFIKDLSSRFAKVYPKFNSKKFSQLVFSKGWEQKELKERMRHISMALKEVLPNGFPKAVKIIIDVTRGIEIEGFEYMFFPDYIEVFGKNHWKASIDAIEKITPVASGEYAVRTFILLNHEKMLKTMKKWAKSKNFHVRRLASEGCRPRLPWSIGLPVFQKEPTGALSILEILKKDPELYVRRSVANNLNDISKDNPDILINLLKKWNTDKSAEMQWLVKHSLRTLEKQGHKKALRLLGYSTNVKIVNPTFKIKPKRISLGEKLELSLLIKTNSVKSKNIVIDYVVYHKKANGALTPKVFKWSKQKISSKQELSLSKTHHIKAITTRKYYSGKHEIHVQINGKVIAKECFTLKIDKVIKTRPV